MTPTKKLAHPAAGYREGDAELCCGTCAHYREDRSCRLVVGRIDRRFWCRFWTEVQP